MEDGLRAIAFDVFPKGRQSKPKTERQVDGQSQAVSVREMPRRQQIRIEMEFLESDGTLKGLKATVELEREQDRQEMQKQHQHSEIFH